MMRSEAESMVVPANKPRYFGAGSGCEGRICAVLAMSEMGDLWRYTMDGANHRNTVDRGTSHNLLFLPKTRLTWPCPALREVHLTLNPPPIELLHLVV